MKVFFYHIDPVFEEFELWRRGEFPGHLLYGMTHFENYGIECQYYGEKFDFRMKRLKLMFYNLYELLFKRNFDLLYAVSHRGLELIIFLRAIGLFHKPIIVWHHSAVINPSNFFRKKISEIFYKGIDRMCFFSEELIERSISTGKVSKLNSVLVHWGADLEYYSKFDGQYRSCEKFISTGVENRDFTTLIKALNETGAPCDIYTRFFMNRNYLKEVENKVAINANVHFKMVNKSVPEMAQIVSMAYCVVICCLDYPYTVGLTTLVEAMALGMPIIVTDNPTFEMDIEKEGAGIKVAYGDVEGWIKAINYIAEHPLEAKKMGRKARLLAEKQYNLEILSKEVAEVILSFAIHK